MVPVRFFGRDLTDHARWLSVPPFGLPLPKPLDNRRVLSAILFVFKTALPWERLPQELGWMIHSPKGLGGNCRSRSRRCPQ